MPDLGGYIERTDDFSIAWAESCSPAIAAESSCGHFTARVLCGRVVYGYVVPRVTPWDRELKEGSLTFLASRERDDDCLSQCRII